MEDYGETTEEMRLVTDLINSLPKGAKAVHIKAALEDGKRSGRPSIFDGKARAKITALACSPAPEGYSQWSLRLLADKAVELKLVEDISHTQVGKILKKTTSAPIKKGSGV
jgi:hypothetical protein